MDLNHQSPGYEPGGFSLISLPRLEIRGCPRHRQRSNRSLYSTFYTRFAYGVADRAGFRPRRGECHRSGGLTPFFCWHRNGSESSTCHRPLIWLAFAI